MESLEMQRPMWPHVFLQGFWFGKWLNAERHTSTMSPDLRTCRANLVSSTVMSKLPYMNAAAVITFRVANRLTGSATDDEHNRGGVEKCHTG